MAAHVRTLRGALLCTALAVAMMIAWSPVALAEGPPLTGSGTGFLTAVDETSSRDAGGNRIAERTIHGVLTSGPLSGTFVQHVRGVIHPNGQVTFQGTMVFTGTAEGCGDGTVTARITGKGAAGERPVTDARITLVDQSAGSLATGTGTVQQDGPLVTYTVAYRCR